MTAPRRPRTCVSPEGCFRVGIHTPAFDVANFRETDGLSELGRLPDGTPVENRVNFPVGDVHEPAADRIYEIPNAFPFRGATFINSAWADTKAGRPDRICIPKPVPCSLLNALEDWKPGMDAQEKTTFLSGLPQPLKIALAQASTDPGDLVALAGIACALVYDPASGRPTGMGFIPKKGGAPRPQIHNHDLFEVLVNNPHLPDDYKDAMVLRPGVQGASEIIGEYGNGSTRVFEYLRRNSYIPWGHYAANMANDAVRYSAADLSPEDMRGIRHLYYQRVFARLAAQLGIPMPPGRRSLSRDALEALRLAILTALASAAPGTLAFSAALWGWNFGFGAAQSGHRLHASHQMIHQQNALVPETVRDDADRNLPAFACGDLVADLMADFRAAHDRAFFPALLEAIQTNTRTDRGDRGESSLIAWEDDNAILYAPKAQVSEWELQLITRRPVAHILDADTGCRDSLDLGILKAVQTQEALGAQMVTSIEFSGRFGHPGTGQHLVYSFIPRLPYAPGTFSEAQLRWISGCYPEDFAHACRNILEDRS